MKNKITFEMEINHVLTALNSMDVTSQEYGTGINNLKGLCEAGSKKSSNFVDWNTIMIAGSNIIGILLILNYEQLHVISTKAIGFVLKSRI
jgi:hypothetical protein